jgi:hypothetical protein
MLQVGLGFFSEQQGAFQAFTKRLIEAAPIGEVKNRLTDIGRWY